MALVQSQHKTELEPPKPLLDEKKRVPKVEWTIPRVKKELGKKWGDKLPDSALMLIIKSEKPEEKIAWIKWAFVEIAKATDPDIIDVFKALQNEKVAKLFVQYPKTFVEIAKATGLDTSEAFKALQNEKVAKLFVQYPKTFVEIAKAADIIDVFKALQNESVVKRFMDYCNGKMTFDVFIPPILATPKIAIELGRSMDDLHEDTPARMKFLGSLSTIQVFSLLISNPEYFYTSSNHLLFDRLKKDLAGKSISDFFSKYDLLGTELYRNFIFRAINYDRFYGKSDSVFKEADLKSAIDSMLSPLSSEKFDQTYFFLLANGLDKIKVVPSIKGEIEGRISSRLKELHAKAKLTDDEKQITSALEYIAYTWDSKTPLVSEEKKSDIRKLEEKGFFVPSNYTVDGKLQVMQVFVKEDTKDYDWGATQNWFAKYAKAKKGEDGELIYETKNAKIILFAGEDENQNQDFIKKQLEKNPNMIISFRGHSFNLEKNFPYGIFGNRKTHILFIPGSCGSAGSTPMYVSANKDTDLRFFSNTSTGMGQVTNTIVDALINTRSRREFKTILKENSSKIEANGMGHASAETIKVWSPGEALLAYVYSH